MFFQVHRGVHVLVSDSTNIVISSSTIPVIITSLDKAGGSPTNQNTCTVHMYMIVQDLVGVVHENKDCYTIKNKQSTRSCLLTLKARR